MDPRAPCCAASGPSVRPRRLHRTRPTSIVRPVSGSKRGRRARCTHREAGGPSRASFRHRTASVAVAVSVRPLRARDADNPGHSRRRRRLQTCNRGFTGYGAVGGKGNVSWLRLSLAVDQELGQHIHGAFEAHHALAQIRHVAVEAPQEAHDHGGGGEDGDRVGGSLAVDLALPQVKRLPAVKVRGPEGTAGARSVECGGAHVASRFEVSAYHSHNPHRHRPARTIVSAAAAAIRRRPESNPSPSRKRATPRMTPTFPP